MVFTPHREESHITHPTQRLQFYKWFQCMADCLLWQSQGPLPILSRAWRRAVEMHRETTRCVPVLSVLSMTGFQWADSLLSTPQEEGRSRGCPSTYEDEHFQVLWMSDAAECLLLRGMGYGVSWKKQTAASSQFNWLRKANWILTYVLDTLKNVSVSLGPVSSKKDVKLCNVTWSFYMPQWWSLVQTAETQTVSNAQVSWSIGPSILLPRKEGHQGWETDGDGIEWFLLRAYTRE